ncbi:MAG: TetR/AcrR family transcriptional regulator [Thermoleophilaceae bacterium]|nr:TetR/AcrR family transcriptional regulator [Thermoleophilaceae bacterium]
MSGEKRKYTKKQRAEAEAETRLRITESAMELHGTVGPSRTSVSAVAERAGVRRSTVYRHFPDEAALFAACSAHWAAGNPPPDIGAWAAIDDPGERVRRALPELYAYYRRTERMLSNLLRDEDLVPAVKGPFAAYHGYLAAARDVLAAGRGRRAQVKAAAGHAVSFATWRSLTREQGLSDDRAAGLMARLVEAASA